MTRDQFEVAHAELRAAIAGLSEASAILREGFTLLPAARCGELILALRGHPDHATHAACIRLATELQVQARETDDR